MKMKGKKRKKKENNASQTRAAGRKETAASNKAVTLRPLEEKTGESGGKRFPIVGIGASAGGLEAFEQFFTHMPPDSGMAFVLVPHLSPEHKSMMAELLSRYTAMEISEAEEGMNVRPNRVYIIPPNKDMSISKGTLLLQDPTEQRGVRHPIDFFFRALAQDQGEWAVCVILSGTGTEGALGLRAVKGEGGLVLAQDLTDAKYEGMPASAIATGLVDHVLPAGKMPELLLRYAKVAARTVVPLVKPEERPVESLQQIFVLIRAQTGHDFTLYKHNTIIRRINKRMAIHQIENFNDYIAYLRSNPHEIDILVTELLIRVTSFFREPEAFESLKTHALPLIFKDKSYDHSMRIWVPGCSTGEEAYSLAILTREFLKEQKGAYKVQIFATDIDTGAIDIARAGSYSESITEDVTPERLSRNFIKKGGAYRVKDEIREMVVFADQDLIKDPPFSRLDLISCRNLLIYMGAALQKKILSLFHYALKPEGVLFLGASETVGESSDMFSALDKRWRIFRGRRLEALPPAAIDMRYPILKGGKERPGAGADIMQAVPKISDFTERLLLERYSPPCAVVNEKGDILYFHGRTGMYLEPATGKAALNIFDMAREGIQMEIRTGMRKAATMKKDVVYKGLRVKTNGGDKPLNLELKYITKPPHLEGLILVVFNEAVMPTEEKTTGSKTRSQEKRGEQLAAIEYELKSTREHLQTTIEELETSNEELKSTNEELQSSNEELQSTNEELETSREELQSSNEELLTINAELQHKLDELSEANSDIINLLASTQIATIFLSYDLRIRRFTPKATDVINIIQTDVGRPVSDISTKIAYPDLLNDSEEVLGTLVSKEKTIQHHDGRWFLVRIFPYRTEDNVIDGIVLTFVDITEQKRAQEFEASLASWLEGITDMVREPLLLLDNDLRVISANRAFCEAFKVAAEETGNRTIYEIGDRQWDIQALRQILDDVLTKNAQIQNHVVEHDFPRIGRKKVLVNARRIHHQGPAGGTILLAIGGVTGNNQT